MKQLNSFMQKSIYILMGTLIIACMAACGGDDDVTPPSPTPTPTPTPDPDDGGGTVLEAFDADAVVCNQATYSAVTGTLNGEVGGLFTLYIGDKNTGQMYDLKKLKWSSSNTSVATVKPHEIYSTTYYDVSLLAEGTTTITVTDEKNATRTANISVKKAGGGEIPVTDKLQWRITGVYNGDAYYHDQDDNEVRFKGYGVISSIDNDGTNFYYLARKENNQFLQWGGAAESGFEYYTGNGTIFKGQSKYMDVGSNLYPIHTVAMRYQDGIGLVTGGVFYDASSTDMLRPKVGFINYVNAQMVSKSATLSSVGKDYQAGYRYYVSDVYAASKTKFYMSGTVDRQNAPTGKAYYIEAAGRVWTNEGTNATTYKDCWKLWENTTSKISCLEPMLENSVVKGFYMGGIDKGNAKIYTGILGNDPSWVTKNGMSTVEKLKIWKYKNKEYRISLCDGTLYIDDFKAWFGRNLAAATYVYDFCLGSDNKLYVLKNEYGTPQIDVLSDPTKSYSSTASTIAIFGSFKLSPPYLFSVIPKK